jgi:hypothetical protein
MNAVVRQRRINARRITQATAATAAAAAVVLGGGVARASTPTELRPRAVTSLPVVSARDRVDAVSGVPTAVDLLTGELPTDRALVALTATPAHGRVVLNDDATATYTSAPGFTGGDSFAYRYTDDRGRTSRVTVAVTVSRGSTPASAYAASAYAA